MMSIFTLQSFIFNALSFLKPLQTILLLLILLTACAVPPQPAAPPIATPSPVPPTPSPVATSLPTLAPTDTPSSSSVPANLENGVEGRVELGPTCGNVPIGGEADCANQPHQAQLTIVDENEEVVITGMSARDGAFRFGLPPGHYRLVPEESRFLSVSPIDFTVEPNQFTYVTVLYDTNIQ